MINAIEMRNITFKAQEDKALAHQAEIDNETNVILAVCREKAEDGLNCAQLEFHTNTVDGVVRRLIELGYKAEVNEDTLTIEW